MTTDHWPMTRCFLSRLTWTSSILRFHCITSPRPRLIFDLWPFVLDKNPWLMSYYYDCDYYCYVIFTTVIDFLVCCSHRLIGNLINCLQNVRIPLAAISVFRLKARMGLDWIECSLVFGQQTFHHMNSRNDHFLLSHVLLPVCLDLYLPGRLTIKNSSFY